MEPIKMEQIEDGPIEQRQLEDKIDIGPMEERTLVIGPDGFVTTQIYRPDKRYETR